MGIARRALLGWGLTSVLRRQKCQRVERAKAKIEALKQQRVAFEARMKKMPIMRRRKQRERVQVWTGAFCLEEAAQNGTLEALKTKVAESRSLSTEKRLVMEWEAEGEEENLDVEMTDIP